MRSDNRLILGDDSDKDAWLAQRHGYVTGSDISVLTGDNKYKSLQDLYQEKMSDTPVQIPTNRPMAWGKYREAHNIDAVRHITGCRVRPCHLFVAHPTCKVAATLDGIIAAPTTDKHLSGYDSTGCVQTAVRDMMDLGGTGILELKHQSFFSGKNWIKQGVPRNYYMQVQLQLLVTGSPWALIASVCGGQDIHTHVIVAHQGVHDDIVRLVDTFWSNVDEARQ